MDEHRAILVAFSAICGCVLLVFAVWHTVKARGLRGFGRRSLVLWIYGGLFLIASLVLWNRDQTVHFSPPMSAPQTGAVSPLASSRTTDSKDSVKEYASTKESEAGLKANVFQESPLTDDNSVFVDETVSLSRRDFRATANRRILNVHPSLPITHSSDRPFEDIVYAAVAHTFDAIEDWFLRYGTATVASGETVRRQTIRETDFNIEHLPPIFFAPNTAELTAESASDLRKIAGLFRSRAGITVIEIQARTESTGPEPYNYILTQARAEVVRDFLTKEGINTDRLVARAMGSGGADSTALRSHIQFVVQR